MKVSTTWAGIRFTATANGPEATNIDKDKPLNILDLVCATDRGYVYRGSAGRYPWGSAVILVMKVDDKLSAYSYPTEINPRGTLEVDCDMWQAMAELQPKIYLPMQPRHNLCNGCYEWRLFLEGKCDTSEAIEVGYVSSVDEAWSVGYNNTVVTLQKGKTDVWTREGYEKYRYLANDLLEKLKNTVVVEDDEDDWDSEYLGDYLEEFEEE